MESEKTSEPPQDELEALRTRVAELEDSQPKDLEMKELKSEVRSAGKKTSRTIIILAVALVFGNVLGLVVKKVFFPSPTIHQRECAKFGIECSS